MSRALTAGPLKAAALTWTAAAPPLIATPLTDVPPISGHLLHLEGLTPIARGHGGVYHHHVAHRAQDARKLQVCACEGEHSAGDARHLHRWLKGVHLILFPGRWCLLSPWQGFCLTHFPAGWRRCITGKATNLSCKVPVRNKQGQHFPEVAAKHEKIKLNSSSCSKQNVHIQTRFQELQQKQHSPHPQKRGDVAGRDTRLR